VERVKTDIEVTDKPLCANFYGVCGGFCEKDSIFCANCKKSELPLSIDTRSSDDKSSTNPQPIDVDVIGPNDPNSQLMVASISSVLTLIPETMEPILPIARLNIASVRGYLLRGIIRDPNMIIDKLATMNKVAFLLYY
jgi:hypothetical protein